MFDDLKGKRVLITGASGGIGREIAVFLSREGAQLALMGRDETRLHETLSRLTPGEHAVFPCDLSNIDAIGGKIDTLCGQFGKLGGLVHCAGIGAQSPIKSLSYEKLHAVMQVNFYAFMELIRWVTVKRNRDPILRIVGLSSVASVLDTPMETAYAAAKAAMDAAVRCLSRELQGKGIRINTIRPAWVDTGMYRAFIADMDAFGAATANAQQPIGVIEPVDVAAMAAYLLSDYAKSITGMHFPINGGSRV